MCLNASNVPNKTHIQVNICWSTGVVLGKGGVKRSLKILEKPDSQSEGETICPWHEFSQGAYCVG